MSDPDDDMYHDNLDEHGEPIEVGYGNTARVYYPMLCVAHGGSPACELENLQHGFTCPKCAVDGPPQNPLSQTKIDRPIDRLGGLLPDAAKIDALVAEARAFLKKLDGFLDRAENEGKITIDVYLLGPKPLPPTKPEGSS